MQRVMKFKCQMRKIIFANIHKFFKTNLNLNKNYVINYVFCFEIVPSTESGQKYSFDSKFPFIFYIKLLFFKINVLS